MKASEEAAQAISEYPEVIREAIMPAPEDDGASIFALSPNSADGLPSISLRKEQLLPNDLQLLNALGISLEKPI